jgi:hypothetical protein
MNQMQRQYEQRIEAMEAKMKALESNASSGSILNTRVLGDASGTEAPGKAPAPMLDESFLKSLTRNFTFQMYVRAGFMFNGSDGAGLSTLKYRITQAAVIVSVTKTTSTWRQASTRLTSWAIAPTWRTSRSE